MQATLIFLLQHGYLVLFVWVFLEQLGLPVPALPMLLAAGAMAGAGRMALGLAILVTLLGAISADAFWFAFGRWRGSQVLSWICKMSFEPDSCVRRTEEVYGRYGAKSLMVAKFIPGFGSVAAPLAGIFRMHPLRFAFFDASGVLIWSVSYIGLGFLFANQLEMVATYILRMGAFLVVLAVGGLVAYLCRKYIQRQRFFKELRIARITPLELKQKLDSSEPVQIVDLRHGIDFEADPSALPGAIRFDPQDIDLLLPAIAPDREVILYCT